MIVAEDPRGNFTINAKTGEIKPHAVLEYEKIPSTAQANTFNLTVQGFDLGSPSLSSDMTVIIYLVDKNNNLPVFSRLQYSVTIPEDTPGLIPVLQVAATDGDPDSRARLHYSVEPGLSTARTEQGRLPLSDWAGMFPVDPSSGEVVVSANLNREAVEQLKLQVVVEDLPAERQSSHSYLNIRVEDVSNNSQVFMSTEYSGLVTENSPVGINILSVLATDADVNKTINITLLITLFVQSK